MPTIEAWETALATRDTVFLQLAVMAVIVAFVAGFLFRISVKIARIFIGLGVAALLVLLVFSVGNIYQWTP